MDGGKNGQDFRIYRIVKSYPVHPENHVHPV